MKTSQLVLLALLGSCSSVAAQLDPNRMPDIVAKYEDTSQDPTTLVFPNPAAPSPTDLGLVVVGNNPLFDEDDTEIGIAEAVCTVIGFTAQPAAKVFCTTIFDFGDENIISSAGVLIFDGNADTDGITPITGGTGIYDGVGGYVETNDPVDGFVTARVFLTKNSENTSGSSGLQTKIGLAAALGWTLASIFEAIP